MNVATTYIQAKHHLSLGKVLGKKLSWNRYMFVKYTDNGEHDVYIVPAVGFSDVYTGKDTDLQALMRRHTFFVLEKNPIKEIEPNWFDKILLRLGEKLYGKEG